MDDFHCVIIIKIKLFSFIYVDEEQFQTVKNLFSKIAVLVFVYFINPRILSIINNVLFDFVTNEMYVNITHVSCNTVIDHCEINNYVFQLTNLRQVCL